MLCGSVRIISGPCNDLLLNMGIVIGMGEVDSRVGMIGMLACCFRVGWNLTGLGTRNGRKPEGKQTQGNDFFE